VQRCPYISANASASAPAWRRTLAISTAFFGVRSGHDRVCRRLELRHRRACVVARLDVRRELGPTVESVKPRDHQLCFGERRLCRPRVRCDQPTLADVAQDSIHRAVDPPPVEMPRLLRFDEFRRRRLCLESGQPFDPISGPGANAFDVARARGFDEILGQRFVSLETGASGERNGVGVARLHTKLVS